MKLDGKIWVVSDPTDISVLADVLYETTVARLATLCVGTGVAAWQHANTTLYTDEAEARDDARARLEARDREIRGARERAMWAVHENSGLFVALLNGARFAFQMNGVCPICQKQVHEVASDCALSRIEFTLAKRSRA